MEMGSRLSTAKNAVRLLDVIVPQEQFNYASWPAAANLAMFTYVTRVLLIGYRYGSLLCMVLFVLSPLYCSSSRALASRINALQRIA